ncbi:MAG: hypothetical protein JOZ37_01770 [Actinobacteria bacterium]|nr:hypothetical protein [Actinomycetota bacterium]
MRTRGARTDQAAAEAAAPTDRDRALILDELSEHLEQFRVLGDSDQEATDKVLEALGASGKVEQDMVAQLAVTQPLAHPERFAEAHAVAMHALEVLSRNGAKSPSQLKAGFLTGAAKPLVQQVIRYIVRSHQSHVISSIRDLYARRLAWAPVGDPARVALVRARIDADRATSTYKQKTGGIPTFLAGGAAVSSIAQAAQGGASAAAGSRIGVIVAVLATFVLLAAASWVILQGAAVARRRIRLTMDRPLGALWETIGSCGKPPQDPAGTFAVAAIALTAVGWIIIPLGAVLVFTVF